MNAATISITTTAYLRVVLNNLGVMNPIFVSRNTITGNSKAIPHPNIKLVKLSK